MKRPKFDIFVGKKKRMRAIGKPAPVVKMAPFRCSKCGKSALSGVAELEGHAEDKKARKYGPLCAKCFYKITGIRLPKQETK